METINYKAQQFAKKHGIILNVVSSRYGVYFPEDKESRYIFKLKLSRNKKSYTFDFGQSIKERSQKPNMYIVLACLQKYDVGSFDDFCSEFGYDEDSRTAERTYKSVCKEFKNVERLFGDVLEEMQEIQ